MLANAQLGQFWQSQGALSRANAHTLQAGEALAVATLPVICSAKSLLELEAVIQRR